MSVTTEEDWEEIEQLFKRPVCRRLAPAELIVEYTIGSPKKII
jgi:hypothetical protein